MALLSQIKRVDLGDDEWVDVKKLSVGELRRMRAEARKAGEGIEDKELASEMEGERLSDIALEASIQGWSDETPINSETIKSIPYDAVPAILEALGLGGDKEAPLPTGSPSTDFSSETAEEESPSSG